MIALIFFAFLYDWRQFIFIFSQMGLYGWFLWLENDNLRLIFDEYFFAFILIRYLNLLWISNHVLSIGRMNEGWT